MSLVVLINIVIAVLLDEFLTTLAKAREEDQVMLAYKNPHFDVHVLDELLENLVQYRSHRCVCVCVCVCLCMCMYV